MSILELLGFIFILGLILFLHFLAYPKQEGGDSTLIGIKPIYPLQKFLENLLLPFALAALAYLLMGK
ncbi:hypothetical protein JG537_01575 [Streptococcus sp. SL1232]|uniref:hypothetical protein n=1 Tax=Streptococcus vicugnae TaxID=2740579 RepID=UPI0018F550E6|nr:hypothetical protein [Streptococcus vicugnae]MBJ7540413.1 hypothetical protein [Streptococcus vicugnae]